MFTGQKGETSPDIFKKGWYKTMKRIYALALCAVMALSLTACANAKASDNAGLDNDASNEYGMVSNEGIGGGTVQIANPFVDYETLDDAAKAAGFELTAPETVEGWDGEKIIQVANNCMLQVIFHDGDDNRLFVRKEAGDADISGDYNTYAEIDAVSVGDYSVTLKGNDGTVSTAVWTSNGYSYAVTSDVPMAVDAMTALIAQVA